MISRVNRSSTSQLNTDYVVYAEAGWREDDFEGNSFNNPIVQSEISHRSSGSPRKLRKPSAQVGQQTPIPQPNDFEFRDPNQRYQDTEGVYEDLPWLQQQLDWFGQLVAWGMTQGAGVAALLAELAGNDDAARHLRWFLRNPNLDMWLSPDMAAPVDRMIAELPLWRQVIDNQNATSLPGLLNTQPFRSEGQYDFYRNATVRDAEDTDGDGQNDLFYWWRVGQEPSTSGRPENARSLLNIYTGNDSFIDTSGILRDSSGRPHRDYMTSGDTPVDFTREEFDWFIAMNAFDFSISQVVVVDRTTGNATLYYY